MVASVFIYNKFSTLKLSYFYRAALLNLTYLAAFAQIRVVIRYSLAYNSQIVKVWFNTVIRAAANGYFKFMRKFNLSVSLIKQLMDFFRKFIGVNKSILACCTLA